MIICSCNVLSDHDVRSAVHSAAPRTTFQVYGCLGCSAQCGRCAHTIRKIMNEALAGAGYPAGRAAPSPNRRKDPHHER
jgi:bacterioferritin-associated ferredoxin